jgi:hypothetical protein
MVIVIIVVVAAEWYGVVFEVEWVTAHSSVSMTPNQNPK